MTKDLNWENRAANALKAELKKANLTYDELALRLNAIGVPETNASIRNKLSRGKFSFLFVLQCAEVMKKEFYLRPQAD